MILVLEENTTVDICDVISFYRNDAAKYFKEHLPHVLNGCDEECDYIHQCLKNWEDKRQHYLDAKKSVEMVEMSAKEEENERREYERLKKKFENNPETCTNFKRALENV